MLETKNLVKIYKPKKGVPVTALDNVSITFPKKVWYFCWVNREAANPRF